MGYQLINDEQSPLDIKDEIYLIRLSGNTNTGEVLDEVHICASEREVSGLLADVFFVGYLTIMSQASKPLGELAREIALAHTKATIIVTKKAVRR